MPKRACDGCSIRKIRCEGVQPCRACVKAGLSCTFLKALRKGGPRKPHQKTIQQIQKAQSQLAHPHPHPHPPTSNPAASAAHVSSIYSYYDDSGGSVGSVPSTPERHDSFEQRRHKYQSRKKEVFEDDDDDDDTDELEDSHPAFKPQFPVSVLSIYLEIFHHRLYPTWPIIKHRELLALLKSRPLDPETYTLAITMACATMEQLQLPPWTHTVTPEDTELNGDLRGEILVSSDRFAAEALKLRRKFGFAERPSTDSVLMGLFLHVYFENKKKYVTATLYLREAVSYVQVLRLDREATYSGMDEKEENFKRRVFWLLFITERGHTMVHDMPFVLRNTISMPSFDATLEPLLVGFMNLVQLFASFDQSVIDAWISGDRYSCSKDLLSAMQAKLSTVAPDESAVNETQKTDILITKHWMRTLVWQVAMSHGFLSSSGKEAEGMDIGFPAEVAGDLLGLLGTVRRENVECHGPGMELKLFEVTNSLADVILCVPHMKPASSTPVPPTAQNYYEGAMRFGPRDYLKGLFDLMVNFRGGNPTLINIIKNKASQLLVNEPGCDRLLELPDEERRSVSPQTECSLPNINRGFPSATTGGSNIHPVIVMDVEEADIPDYKYTWAPPEMKNNTPSPKFSDNSRSDHSSPVHGFSGLEVSDVNVRSGNIATTADGYVYIGTGSTSTGSPGAYVDSSGVDWSGSVSDEIMADVNPEWTAAAGGLNTNRAAVTTWMKDVE